GRPHLAPRHHTSTATSPESASGSCRRRRHRGPLDTYPVPRPCPRPFDPRTGESPQSPSYRSGASPLASPSSLSMMGFEPMQRFVPDMAGRMVMRPEIVMVMRMLLVEFIHGVPQMPRHPMSLVRVDDRAGGFAFAPAELRSGQIRPGFVVHVRALAALSAQPTPGPRLPMH